MIYNKAMTNAAMKGPPITQPNSEPLPVAAPAPMPSEQEQAIVQRIERSLLAEIRQIKSATTPHEESVRSSWFAITMWGWRRWVVASATVAVCGLLLVWLAVHQQAVPEPAWPTLTKEGAFANPALFQYFQIAPHREGTLAARNQWKLRAHSGATFGVRRTSRRSLEIRLSQGSIELQVRPLSMKHVEVQTDDVHVLVKGTVFSVERGKQWVRIEVWQGQVLVTQQKKSFSVQAHAGIRIALSQQKRIQHYPLPPKQAADPVHRIGWLARHAPQHLLLYNADLAELPKISAQQQAYLVYEVADHFRRQHNDPLAESLFLQMLQWKLPSTLREQTLFDAAFLCWQQNAPVDRCQGLFQRYLTEYPQGQYSEEALYRLYQLCQKQHTNPKLCQPLLQRYLLQYPQGRYLQHIQRDRQKGSVPQPQP